MATAASFNGNPCATCCLKGPDTPALLAHMCPFAPKEDPDPDLPLPDNPKHPCVMCGKARKCYQVRILARFGPVWC